MINYFDNSKQVSVISIHLNILLYFSTNLLQNNFILFFFLEKLIDPDSEHVLNDQT